MIFSFIRRSCFVALILATPFGGAPAPARAWEIGAPIVTYYQDIVRLPLTNEIADQAVAGNYNLVWVRTDATLPLEQQQASLAGQLAIAEARGLRAQLACDLSEYRPSVADYRAAMEPLIDTFRSSPAAYSYFVYDEPNAARFSELGDFVNYLGQCDPDRLAYINLYPVYASNTQLGTTGDRTTAYNAYLDQYISTAQPSLISYDNYQFAQDGLGEPYDKDSYFQNLGLIRTAAKQAGLPFMNIVQACSWTSSRRVPNENELRFLVYTTLAYGAQGISYFAYNSIVPLEGGINDPMTYAALTPLNSEFVAIAEQTRGLHSIGACHEGMFPPGTEPLPGESPFCVDPALIETPYTDGSPVEGVLLGLFGPEDQLSAATYALLVNLDYGNSNIYTLVGPDDLAIFDATAGTWSDVGDSQIVLNLAPGGGVLVRLASVPEPSAVVLFLTGLAMLLLAHGGWWRC